MTLIIHLRTSDPAFGPNPQREEYVREDEVDAITRYLATCPNVCAVEFEE